MLENFLGKKNLWCPRRDSNSYGRLYVRGILNPLCLPFHHLGIKVKIDHVILERFCQLKSLGILILIFGLQSCSKVEIDNKPQEAPELVTTFQPNWFLKNKEHTLLDKEGNPSIHQFYDVNPEFSAYRQFVNAIVVTPPGSTSEYQIDVLSGQRFFNRTFCNHLSDSFAFGVVPRMLDQLGTPQKIIIFGNSRKLNKFVDKNFLRLKIIGAYIERQCLNKKCDDQLQWMSRLVLIGIDYQDDLYSNYSDLDSFLQKHNWNLIKSEIIEKLAGNELTTNPGATTKIGEPLAFDDALKFLKNNSISLNSKKMNKIQKTCHRLYENLWRDVGEERKEDLPVLTKEKLSEKVQLVKQLRDKKLPVGFAERFHLFTKKFSRDLSVCHQFVYPGNIQDNSDKFWFLQFTLFFYSLHREGYYYDCGHNTWQKNVMNYKGKYIYHLNEKIQFCSEKNIDQAMSFISSSFLDYLKSNELNYFKFIDYDNHVQGTHQKLYSWVKLSDHGNSCKLQNELSKDMGSKLKLDTILFPEDASWKNRKTKDISLDKKIIY